MLVSQKGIEVDKGFIPSEDYSKKKPQFPEDPLVNELIVVDFNNTLELIVLHVC